MGLGGCGQQPLPCVGRVQCPCTARWPAQQWHHQDGGPRSCLSQPSDQGPPSPLLCLQLSVFCPPAMHPLEGTSWSIFRVPTPSPFFFTLSLLNCYQIIYSYCYGNYFLSLDRQLLVGHDAYQFQTAFMRGFCYRSTLLAVGQDFVIFTLKNWKNHQFLYHAGFGALLVEMYLPIYDMNQCLCTLCH